MKKQILFNIIFLLLSGQVYSASLHQQGQSTRSLGMGGTIISFVRGSDAMFYNPAALSKIEGLSLNLIDFGAGLSTNGVSKSKQLSGSGGSFTAADLNSLYGETFFVEASGRGGLAIPHFGVGAYSNNTTLMKFSNPANPNFNVNFISDYGYVVAGSFDLSSDLSFGLAGRHVKRWGDTQDISVLSLVGSDAKTVIQNAIQARGSGNAMDLSLLYTPQTSSNVSLAMVWKDVGNTRFEPSVGNGPERQEDNLIFGASTQHELGFITWTNAFEYKFIRNSDDITKKLHLGSELSLGLFDLRAGLYQGYLSYGAAVDLAIIRIEAAAYTAELGTGAGQTSNDRYQASISLNFDFDQSFKLQAEDGKKRRLKLRR